MADPTPTRALHEEESPRLHRPLRGLRRVRTIAMLPTLFTLGNLVCGFFAIVVAARIEKPTTMVTPSTSRVQITSPMNPIAAFNPTDDTHNIMLSGWLIFLAMVFDAFDGHLARLAKVSSQFGAQLDSLCDLVTFGVAPGFLLVKMIPEFTFQYPGGVWIIAVVFPICAALRLARFNVETGKKDDHLTFSGLPSPAAAASIAGFAILFYTLRRDNGNTPRSEWSLAFDEWMQYVLPIFSLCVAALMVSRIPYPHVVNRVIRGRRTFGHLVGLLFAIVFIGMFSGYSVPLLSAVFVFSPPILFFWNKWRGPQPIEESLF